MWPLECPQGIRPSDEFHAFNLDMSLLIMLFGKGFKIEITPKSKQSRC